MRGWEFTDCLQLPELWTQIPEAKSIQLQFKLQSEKFRICTGKSRQICLFKAVIHSVFNFGILNW